MESPNLYVDENLMSFPYLETKIIVEGGDSLFRKVGLILLFFLEATLHKMTFVYEAFFIPSENDSEIVSKRNRQD